ncbi:MAG: Gfo/Idh/MocA family oxidoreductase [Pirellulaceae bacterium]|nr:Gfo/Idh/MocA family oxidoreductase [Pirellulaceae bacterium]
MKRREFVKGSAAAAGLSLARAASAKASVNDRITLAMIGVRGRGRVVLESFAKRPDVDVKYVCDIDQSVLGERTERLAKETGKRHEMIDDFRRALEDPAVDAVAVATPTHWHGIISIMACQAKKDVYVEKPDAHNAVEGRVMVEAARKHKRVVQLGTQSRSGASFLSAMTYLQKGHIGRPLFAKAWESHKQGSLGHPPDSDPPAGVDYNTWLGPAPLRPFNRMRFHGNWRWFFDYGAGDLGNDGVHRLDYARWGFDVALQAAGQSKLGTLKAVSAHGGKCYFDDIQEWPDNLMITYDYGQGRVMTYEMRIWTPYPMEGESEGAIVYGDQGYIVIGNKRWRAFGAKGKLLVKKDGTYQNTDGHVANFIDCMRSRERPNSDLETVGHPSSLMCHLGNAAWRAGRTIRFDADTYTCIGDDDANQYLERPEYRQPWTLPRLEDV